MLQNILQLGKDLLSKVLDPNTLSQLSSLKDNTGNVLDGLKKSLEGVQDTVSSTKETLGIKDEIETPHSESETYLESTEEENPTEDTTEEEIDDSNTSTEENEEEAK